jgi:hypothetical protein
MSRKAERVRKKPAGDFPLYKVGPSVKDMVDLLSTAFCRCRALMVLKAYFDESGHHSGARVFALAGYMSYARNWYKFEREWKNVLLRFGVKVFHMVDCAHRKREFQGWSEEKRRSLLESLLNVIYRKPPKLWGIGAVVDIDAFARLSESARAKVGNDPYWLCFQFCAVEATNLIDHLEPDTKVAFIFHRKDNFEQHALRLFGRMKDDKDWPRRDRLGSIAFAPAAEFVPLQAADMFAYELFKDMGIKAQGKDQEMRYPLKRIIEGPQKVYSLDKRSLKLALEIGDSAT